MKKIYNIQGDNYVPISSGRNYVFRQYESIYSFLKRNFSEEIAAVLAKPIQSGEGVTFYTDHGGNFQSLQDFSTEVRQNILIKYNSLLYTIHKKCDLFEQSSDLDYVNWGKSLRTVFDHDSNLIFSDGTNLVIVWGWKFRLKADYHLPFDVFSHTLLNENIDSESNELDVDHKDEASVAENDDFQNLKEENLEEITTPTTEEEEPLTEEEFEEIQDPLILNSFEEKSNPVVPKKKWFLILLDSFEKFAKRFWWIILIFLIILFWLLFFDGCERKAFSAANLSPEDQNILYAEIMPNLPRHHILPIDTNNFIDDENTHSRIISNVINIALKNKTQNFKHFIIDLKHEFDDESYKVVYFDDETSRLQLSFPEEERSDIKKNIKNKLKKYSLLIWDEAVFQSSSIFNDPVFKDKEKSWYFHAINTEKAWDITKGDTSVVIAIIDDGFDIDHVEFRNRIVHQYNIVSDEKIITSGPDRMHGTHVAGIALAVGGNGKGSCGIAPNCRLMPIQAAGEDGFFSMTDVIDGVLYAIKNGADIINMSLGREFSEDLQALSVVELEKISQTNGIDEADFWEELFQIAEDNNVTIVIAAGNQNLLVGLDPMQRSSQVIKVAAIDKLSKKANFSNFFKNVTADCFISAPGVKIYSSIPGNSFGLMDGTSMASPIVAGAIGLMKSANPSLTNSQVRKILHETAKVNSDKTLAPILQVDKAVRMALKS
jgi:subtilisin family serine protease